jgi:polar amino acid transport system substrate-binding protein
MHHKRRWTIVVLTLAVVAAACTTSGESSSTTTPTTAVETTTTVGATTTAAVETTTTQAETTTAAAACTVDNLTLVTPGTLTVATGEPAFPPWVGTVDGEGFDDPTSQLGFEAALVYDIASQLGFSADEVVWTRIGFNEAIAPGPKPWDFNLQQYSITSDRAEIVDFSEPYYTTHQALVVYPDSPYAQVTSVEDLKDAVLGAQVGTTSLDFIEQVIQPTTAPYVYDENVDLEAAMNAGQIDGLVVDLPTAYYITAAQVEGSIIAGEFSTMSANPDQFGILFAKGNPLVTCVNQALDALKADGTLQSLEDTYLTQGGAIPTISG